MARFATSLLLGSAALLLALSRSAYAQDVTLPNGIEAASLSEPTKSDAGLGDNPTISKPDQVFSISGKSGSTSVGVDNGEPVVERSGRKMLGTLALTGSGVSAGDNDLGASANAYGHGDLNGLSDNHIEPHGVQTTADVGGQSYTTNTGVDPDCVAKEGPCVDAGRK